MIPFRITKITKVFYLESLELYSMFDFTELIKYGRQLPLSRRSLLKFRVKIFDPKGFKVLS